MPRQSRGIFHIGIEDVIHHNMTLKPVMCERQYRAVPLILQSSCPEALNIGIPNGLSSFSRAQGQRPLPTSSNGGKCPLRPDDIFIIYGAYLII